MGFLFASNPRVKCKEEKIANGILGLGRSTWVLIFRHWQPLPKTGEDGFRFSSVAFVPKRMENVVVGVIVAVVVGIVGIVGIVDVDYSLSFPSTYERFPNAKREKRH